MSGGLEKLDRTLERILPKLSRGQKLARNLAASALAGVLAWAAAGYPLPTAELEFRRLERTHLLPESETVFSIRGSIRWQDLPELNLPVRGGMVVGVGDGYVHTASLFLEEMDSWPLEEGVTPVPLYRTWVEEQESGPDGGKSTGVPVLFLQVPEETGRAELEVTAEDSESGLLHSQGEGRRLAPGRWLFSASPEHFSLGWCSGGSYTLRLYRTDGSLLSEHSGILGG